MKIRIYIILITLFFGCSTPQNEIVEIKKWDFEYNGDWLKADVPGNNFSDLLDQNIIPDPFYGTNEDSVQWVSEREWVYRSNFKLSKDFLLKEKHEIIFHGLDTYSSVYLNDSLILNANNMFRKWNVPLKGILKDSKPTVQKALLIQISLGLLFVSRCYYFQPVTLGKVSRLT